MKKATFRRTDTRHSAFTHTISLALTLLSVALIIMGAVGLVVLQPKLQLSQDLRNQAASQAGRVRLNTLYEPADLPGENANVVILANTAGLQVDLFQLVFRIITDVTVEPPLVFVPSSSGLETLLQEVETTNDGFLVSIIAAPASGSALFSSTAEETVVEIGFIPQHNGSLQIEVDNDNSVAHVNGTGPGDDELYVTALATYAVTVPVAASPSPTPSASPAGTGTASPSPSPSVIASASPSPSSSASPIITASPSPSPSPAGLGGATIRQCNETCTSNSQCAINHRCYEGRCRLSSNVTNTSCSAPADAGLQRQCNEYCADSRECASSYSCFFNRCRRQDNPDNTSCAAASTTTQQAVAQGCNAGCTSNAQCGINLRCYNGGCRLATNPSSSSCSTASQNKVTQQFYSGTVPATAPKGASGNTNAALPSTAALATPRPLSPVSSPTVGAVITQPTPPPAAEELVELSWWENILTDRNGLISALALLGGALLLLVLIVITGLGLLKKRPSGFTSTTVTKGAPAGAGSAKTTATPGAGNYESYLHQRINQLQGQPGAPTIPAATTTPPAASTPVTPAEPITAPPTSDVSVSPPPMTAPAGYTPNTSMLQSVRDKGITTPTAATPQNPNQNQNT